MVKLGIYILEGHEAVECYDFKQWGEWFVEDTERRSVAHDEIGEARVSTVFLGVDHNFGGSRPLLFETMVFDGELDGEMERYSTWQEAEKGHQAMLARLQKSDPEPEKSDPEPEKSDLERAIDF